MNIYLVGGAVRDQLLGWPIKDRDWVVVGATPEQLLARGYRAVGKDFPVFLHPQTGEEYALARTERKTGRGYHAFSFQADPSVTLESDLLRRDLTINAMAMTPEGQLIDPYRGQQDLDRRILRHVSPAFIEDPVRVLRIARFAAQLGQFDFVVASETKQLLSTMVNNGEVAALVPERVWQEWIKAFNSDYPLNFINVLDECGALAVIAPECADVSCLAQMRARLGDLKSLSLAQRMGVLASCFADTTAWQRFTKRLKLPKAVAQLGQYVLRFAAQLADVDAMTAESFVDLLQGLDAFRRPQHFIDLLAVCAVLYETSTAIQRFESAYQRLTEINAAPFVAAGRQGIEIAKAVRAARIEAMQLWLDNQ